jgi:hypothetical protein
MTPDRVSWLLGDFTWGDVLYWLEMERELLEKIDGASETAEDFEQLAGDLAYESGEPWPPVELGVVSIVAALNAAGCPTAWSNRGSGDSPPAVRFFADQSRARLVLAVAERCKLGLAGTSQGLLELTAGAVDEMLSAAHELVAWDHEFDALPPPPTAALLGADGYWADDLAEVCKALGID